MGVSISCKKTGRTIDMGCGSTGIACMNTDRDFISIELDSNYFAIAKQRFETLQSSCHTTKMF